MENKKGGSIFGGIIFLFIGIGLLWWNEGNNVANIAKVKEGLDNYTDIKSEKVDSKYDGKLVATSGNLDVQGEIVDDEFNVKSNSAVLLRKVEMYQWQESCDENDSCTYEKVWNEDIIDSSNFKENHKNPDTMPYETKKVFSDNVHVGAFSLPSDLIDNLSTKNRITNLNEEIATNHSMKISNNYYTNASDTPEIGNIRISFYDNNSKMVSILATQSNDSFKVYKTKNGKNLFTIYDGEYNGYDMLMMIKKGDNFMKWLLRLVGVLLVVGGVGSVFNPILKLTNNVPILGTVVSGATGIISFILGIGISLIVIAIAWFRFRPILSIVLIAVAILLVVGFKIYNKGGKNE